MKCEERQTQLQDLSAGTLDEPATTALLDHVEDCEGCSRHLDFLADVVHAVQDDAEPTAVPPARPARSRLGRNSVVALVMVLVIGAAWQSLREPARSLASMADHSVPRYLPVSTRDEDQWRRFDQAMQPYQSADYATAVTTLGEFLTRVEEHGPAHFYRGIAHWQCDDLESAARDFLVAAGSEHRTLAADARWRRASMALLQEDEQTARRELRLLGEEDGPYRDDALELLRRLDERR